MQALTRRSHISVVHAPVNAIGKKSSNVFPFPKLSLKPDLFRSFSGFCR